MNDIERSSEPRHQELQQVVMGHACALLPRLRQLPEQDLQQLLEEVDALNQAVPLSFVSGEGYSIMRWDAEQKLSGTHIIALLVFGLWVQCGEDVVKADFLVEKWPQLPQVALQCA